jgi:hypothetical protein
MEAADTLAALVAAAIGRCCRMREDPAFHFAICD